MECGLKPFTQTLMLSLADASFVMQAILHYFFFENPLTLR